MDRRKLDCLNCGAPGLLDSFTMLRYPQDPRNEMRFLCCDCMKQLGFDDMTWPEFHEAIIKWLIEKELTP